jgi:ATP-dependent Lon protease
MEQRQEILPLIPLRGLSVFPHMVLHFDVGREKSIKALEEAMLKDQRVLLTTQKELDVDLPTEDDFYKIGTVSKIKQMLKLPGDAIRVLVEGQYRAQILEITQKDQHFEAKVQIHHDSDYEVDLETKALMRIALSSFEKYAQISNKVTPEIIISISSIDDPGRFADMISAQLTLKIEQKQEILDALEPKKRLETIHKILINEIEILEIEKNINEKVRNQINKLQKEYYLREQLKVIKKELGEENDQETEIYDLIVKLNKLKLDKKTDDKIRKEIDRLSRMAPSSAESGVIRTYVNTILDLPWIKQTKDTLDLKYARKVLDEDHYGLEKVKERVLEYLAIKTLTKSLKGPIICLVGPPGVGKTSIAKSIARALNRKFVRMSLGGVRDEAEIRGHRRTYIGAIPGRIINGIKEAGTKNPLFLFDEIDKLASDFRGDPTSALLEVLDPEQNKDFMDHYLEVSFDLSKVMFVTTANSLSSIPRPLLDRMEIIHVSGYTEDEKLNIAQKYLVNKQMKEHGLGSDRLILPEESIRAIINNYTRESGVRELERMIASVCRKTAALIVEDDKDKIKVTKKNLSQFLGTPKYRYDEISNENEIGIVTGLAWTAVGGETLNVEVTPMKGKGNLVLTGQMGDVMKESARAGFSYLRSISDKLGLDDDFHEKVDIHIHIPEGAIPKDGPSAGITMATAVISALTKVPVDRNVAMTGEITLRGRVLPIGGLKEKTLAAKRAGIKKVIIPYDNIKDLDEIPQSVKKVVEFFPVKTMDEVLEIALVKAEK